MDFSQALNESMVANGLRDEDVAVMTRKSAQSVANWRKGVTIPSLIIAQLLRHNVPGFAERIDSKADRHAA